MSSSDVADLLCPPILALPPQLPVLKVILIDSSIYNYQAGPQSSHGCLCLHSPLRQPRHNVLATARDLGYVAAWPTGL